MAPCNGTLTGVARIFAGENDAFAVMNDGTVRAWGDDAYGELGNGTSCGSFPCTSYTSPVSVPALTGVSQIAVGSWHGLALMPAGNVLSWGDNGSGQLGINSACNGGVESCTGSATPTAVGGLTGVTEVAAAGDFSAAVRSDGTLWTWGNNGSGELGKPACGSEPCYSAGNGKPAQVGGISGVIEVYLEQRNVIALSK
jgi:alpha-tubulin suppressor-like RCC1 family protein